MKEKKNLHLILANSLNYFHTLFRILAMKFVFGREISHKKAMQEIVCKCNFHRMRKIGISRDWRTMFTFEFVSAVEYGMCSALSAGKETLELLQPLKWERLQLPMQALRHPLPIQEQIFDFTIPKGMYHTNAYQIRQGTTSPASTLGIVGDWYINASEWDVCQKTSATAWTNRGNIKRSAGPEWIPTVNNFEIIETDFLFWRLYIKINVLNHLV